MCNILVLYESAPPAGLDDGASAVANGAEAAGANVALASFGEAALADIAWADGLALGIDARGSNLPWQVKRWLDALGFSGWRGVLNGKPACVFAAGRQGSPDADVACQATARVLEARGMNAVIPSELEAGGVDRHTLGHILGTRFPERRPPAVTSSRASRAERPPANAGAVAGAAFAQQPGMTVDAGAKKA